MFKKHGILAVTMFLSLILANGVGAGTELEDIVNNKQTATWAYYTDEIDITKISSSSRWYISPLVSGVPNINDVFSLGHGVGGWWTVGKGVGTIDTAMTQITIAPNLDTDPSNTFFDVGRQINVTDPGIHADRQRVQDKKHPIVWYFFNVPNRTWYIVNASRTGPSWDVYRLGWAADGGYDWSRVDISGYSVAHTPDPSGHTLAITFTVLGFVQEMSAKTTCNAEDWNLRYGIYLKVYWPLIYLQREMLLERLTGVNNQNIQWDNYISIANLVYTIKKQFGMTLGKDIVVAAFTSTGTVLKVNNIDFIPTILAGIDTAISTAGLTGSAAAVSLAPYLVVETLTTANNLYALVQINYLTDQLNSSRLLGSALLNYYRSCGTMTAGITALSDQASAANILQGVNKTFRSMTTVVQ